MQALHEEKGWSKGLCKLLCVLFGGGIFFTFFLSLQNYTVSEAIGSTFGVNYVIPGLVLSLAVCAVIWGGLKGVGKISSYAELWVMADFSSALPTFVNLFALFFLTGKFFELIKDYKARYMGIGQVDPNFKVFYEG